MGSAVATPDDMEACQEACTCNNETPPMSVGFRIWLTCILLAAAVCLVETLVYLWMWLLSDI